MRRGILAVTILALLLIAANQSYQHLVEITVINKSGLPVEMSLTGSNAENFYYLRIPKGDRDAPLEKTFTLLPDVYRATVYYIEPWDPVYGYDCSSKSDTLNANHKLRVTILECTRTTRGGSDYPIIKFGASGRSRRR